MHVLDTQRLRLSHLSDDDVDFVVELLNEPSFVHNIGDKGVRDAEGARRYLRDGPLASYQRHGFGLWRVALRDGDAPVGMCGLLQREHLPDPDLGYAFLPRFWSRGYAFESAAAVMRHARQSLGLGRVVAIVNADNRASIRLLEKLGMTHERDVTVPESEHPVRLYASEP